MPTTVASNLDEEFAQVRALWSPRVIAVANGQHVKVAISTSIKRQLAHLHATNHPTRLQETPAQWPSKS